MLHLLCHIRKKIQSNVSFVLQAIDSQTVSLFAQISKYGIKFNNFTYIHLQILVEGSLEAYWQGASSDGKSFRNSPISRGSRTELPYLGI